MEKEPKQCEYWETVFEEEEILFPEKKKIAKEDGNYGSSIPNMDGGYIHFFPSYHFRKGLITEKNLNDLINDPSKKLLSVGAGYAYLEKFLVYKGIKNENITLADINKDLMPQEFHTITMNMFDDWKEVLDNKYDLIIFPESVFTYSDSNFDKKKFNSDNLYERNNNIINLIYKLILKSIKHLKSNGEIRMTTPILYSSLMDNLVDKLSTGLKQDGYNISIQSGRELLVVKNNINDQKIT